MPCGGHLALKVANHLAVQYAFVMERERRTAFFVKLITGGLAAAAGVALVLGGLSAPAQTAGIEGIFLLLLGVGLGALFLRLAWKAFGA